MPGKTLVQDALYGILVILGILGNTLVLLTIVATSCENRSIPASNLILAHLAAINLLMSAFRNILIFASQVGLEILLSDAWCKVFMFIWMFLRSLSVWATFCVSFFHYLSIRRTHFHIAGGRKTVRNVAKAISAMWILNFLYSAPAFVYSARGANNTTFSLMLLTSTTTRPLLGCVWKFPSQQSSLLYISASLVIHEVLPIFLMLGTNLCTLHRLKRHTRAIGVGVPVPRVLSEHRAAKVILVLVLLFVACWGTNVLAVNYYNFARGDSASSLVTLANFCASLFLGFSPLVLVVGHSKLRQKLKRMVLSTLCRKQN